MSSPTITYRAIDADTYEPLWGQGQSNFISDIDAVAQAIGTRIRLLQGEWWADLHDGTPLFQSMLGVSGVGKNPSAITLALVARIQGTPFVTGISEITTLFDPPTRAFTFSANVQTQFGVVTLQNIPVPPSKALP